MKGKFGRIKWSKPPRTIAEALDILDIDKNRNANASDRRGAIKLIREVLKNETRN